MHFPELTSLAGSYGRFTCFQTTLMNFCKRKVPELEPDLSFILFQYLLNNFIYFCAFFTFIFAPFHKCHRCFLISDPHFRRLNNNYYFFWCWHISLLLARFITGLFV